VLAEEGELVDPVTPTVSGRTALVRVEVEPDAAFVDRALSIQLELQHTVGDPELFETEMMVSAANPSFAAEWIIPATSLADRPGYVVRVIEVDQPTEAVPNRPRIPGDTTGDFHYASHPARIDLTLVPVLHQLDECSRSPALDDDFLNAVRDRVHALYPTSAVELTVRPEASFTGPTDDLVGVLERVTLLRLGDDAEPQSYYAAILDPCDTPTNAGVAGLPLAPGLPSSALGRVSVNVVYDFEPGYVLDTVAHEIGHNMGRPHVACAEETLIDPGYPHPGGSIGADGFDVTTETSVDATSHYDFMSYCVPYGVSDFGWAIAHDVLEATAAWPSSDAESTDLSVFFVRDGELTRRVDTRGPRLRGSVGTAISRAEHGEPKLEPYVRFAVADTDADLEIFATATPDPETRTIEFREDAAASPPTTIRIGGGR